MLRQRIIFGQYSPDNAQFLTDGLSAVVNAYPTANGYAPVGQFEAVTDNLPAKFNGGAAFVDSAETGTLIAGTTSNLYRSPLSFPGPVKSFERECNLKTLPFFQSKCFE